MNALTCLQALRRYRWGLASLFLVLLVLAALSLKAALALQGPQTLLVCPDRCPFSSLEEALQAARPGDTLWVWPGVYPEDVRITQPITLKGAGAKRVTLEGSLEVEGTQGVTLSGLTIQGRFGLTIRDSERVVLRDLAVEWSQTAGVTIAHSAVAIEESTVRHNFGGGVRVLEGSRVRLTANALVSNQGDGLEISGDSVAQLEQNLFRENAGCAVRASEGSQLSGEGNRDIDNQRANPADEECLPAIEASSPGDLWIEFMGLKPPPGVRAYHGVVGQPLRVRVRIHYTLGGGLLLRAQPLSFSVGFYLSPDEQVTSDDLRLGGVQIEDFAGALQDVEVTLVLPSDLLAGGTFVSWRPTYLGAIVDEADEVEESDEANNAIVRSGFLVRRSQLAGYPGGVRAVAFSPDGGLLAFAFCEAVSEAKGCSRGKIQLVLPLQGGTVRAWVAHEGQIRALAFRPDGGWLASGADDGTIALWDAAAGQELRRWQGHQDWVSSLAFSLDGWLLASGSWDGTIKLWTAGAGRLMRTLAVGAAVLAVAFSPDGRLLASGSADGLVRLWDAETGELLRTLSGHEGWVLSVAFSPDGKLLASSGRDGTVRLWDPASGRPLSVLGECEDWVRAVAFHPSGRLLASASDDGTITLWDIETGEVQRVLQDHEGWIFSIAFSPGGGLLASGSRDGTVRLWSGF